VLEAVVQQTSYELHKPSVVYFSIQIITDMQSKMIL